VLPLPSVVPVCDLPLLVLRASTIASGTGMPIASSARTGMTVKVFWQVCRGRPPSGRFAGWEPHAVTHSSGSRCFMRGCLANNARPSQGRPLIAAVVPLSAEPRLVGGLLFFGGPLDALQVDAVGRLDAERDGHLGQSIAAEHGDLHAIGRPPLFAPRDEAGRVDLVAVER